MIAILILLPSIGLVGYFVYASIGWNVIVSLTDWNTLKPSYNIIGFSHYAEILQDSTFWISFQNNLLLILLFVPSSILLGLFLAILLDNKVKVEGVFRTIYLLPFITKRSLISLRISVGRAHLLQPIVQHQYH